MDHLSISADGRFIVGETINGQPCQVVLLDCATGETNILSVTASGAPGSRSSRWPTVSADARYVAFLTSDSGIVPGNTNHSEQVVVRDRQLGATILASAAPDGSCGNNHSSKPIFAWNGRTPVFQSMGGSVSQIIWTGNPARTHQLEFKEDLTTASWNVLDVPIAWNGSNASATDTTAGTNRFYRVVRVQ